MPLDTQKMSGENTEYVLALCNQLKLDYEYSKPILCIKTAYAEWEIDLSKRPVVIDHKPNDSNEFHRQHKMFLSVTDAVHYINRHDNSKKPTLKEMLSNSKRK